MDDQRDYAEEEFNRMLLHEEEQEDEPLTELEKLRRRTVPVPGMPGCRVDKQGRRWYSAGWLGLSE